MTAAGSNSTMNTGDITMSDTSGHAELETIRALFSRDGKPCPQLLCGQPTIAKAIAAMLHREAAVGDAMRLLELAMTGFRIGNSAAMEDLEAAVGLLRAEFPVSGDAP